MYATALLIGALLAAEPPAHPAWSPDDAEATARVAAAAEEGVEVLRRVIDEIAAATDEQTAVAALAFSLANDDLSTVARARTVHVYGLLPDSAAARGAASQIARSLCENQPYDGGDLDAEVNRLGAGRAPRWIAEALIGQEGDVFDSAGALQYLGAAAETAVPVLVDALSSERNATRWYACAALEDLGAVASAADPALRAIVRGETAPALVEDAHIDADDVRAQAAQALGAIGADVEMLVPLLRRMLVEETALELRRGAALGLGNLGPLAKQATPDLVEALADDRWKPATFQCLNCGYIPDHWATTALVNIGPEAIPALAQAMSHANPDVRYHAAEALWLFGEQAAEAAPQLIAALTTPDARVRRRVSMALGSCRSSPETAVPALVTLLDDEDPDVRRAAVFSIGEYGAAAATVSDAVVERLHDPDPAARSAAISAVRKLAAPDRAAAAIAPLLGDSEVEVRESAAEALARLGPHAAVAVPEIVRALQSDTLDAEHYDLVAALGHVGPAAREAMPELIVALSDDDEYVRQEAVDALAAVAPPETAAPEIAKRLLDGDEGVVEAALETLGTMGPAAVAAVSALRDAVHRFEGDLHVQALDALRKVDPAAAAEIDAESLPPP
jgi:HEAT repeat protein